MTMLSLLAQLGLTPEQARILSDQFTSSVTLSPGDFFLKEGKTCHHIGMVTRGMCRYYYHTAEGQVTRWVSLQDDFITSLTSFITQLPSQENIQAMKETEILLMPRERWLAVYEQHEFIRRFWTKNIEANYIGMEQRVFNLIAKPAEARYAWMQEHQPRFIQEVPDKYLASMLGINPRHLSRIRALRK